LTHPLHKKPPHENINIFNAIPKLRKRIDEFENIIRELNDTRDLRLFDNTRLAQLAHPNPLNAFGKKCYSQTDEDGITLEILRRIDCLRNGTYAEYGVGDGTENNTLVLAALG